MLLALAAGATRARADGDPASDYLPSQDVFLPLDAHVSTSRANELAGLVLDAKNKGYRIKVALIATPTDLGAITALWRRPESYAHFLADELRFVFRGRLLIVMPNGFGIYHIRRPVAAEERALGQLTIAPTGDGLASAAVAAVERLAAMRGLHLKPLRVSSGSRATTRDRLAIVLIVAGALAFLAAARSLLVSRRRARAEAGGD